MPRKKNTPRKKTLPNTIECVATRPPYCPKCHCTDRTEKESVVAVEREINGVLQPGNIQFSKVQWNYCECKGCGQRYRFVEYLHPASRVSETKPLK